MKKSMMKKLIAVLLTVCAVSLTACAGGGFYGSFADEGYTIRVRFETGGALVNETPSTTIVELFNESDAVTTADGRTGVMILAPDDPLRGENAFKLSMVDGIEVEQVEERNLYLQAGWYTSRSPRVDAAGNPLDVYGRPTAQSGRAQAYVYDNKWDFENDVVTTDMLTDGELTLYAAWIPLFRYEFYIEGENGFELLEVKTRLLDIRTPVWNERKEAYDMKDFPNLEGKLYEGAYFDEAMTQAVPKVIDVYKEFIDYEKGISTMSTVKIYIACSDAG